MLYENIARNNYSRIVPSAPSCFKVTAYRYRKIKEQLIYYYCWFNLKHRNSTSKSYLNTILHPFLLQFTGLRSSVFIFHILRQSFWNRIGPHRPFDKFSTIIETSSSTSPLTTYYTNYHPYCVYYRVILLSVVLIFKHFVISIEYNTAYSIWSHFILNQQGTLLHR